MATATLLGQDLGTPDTTGGQHAGVRTDSLFRMSTPASGRSVTPLDVLQPVQTSQTDVMETSGEPSTSGRPF